MDTQRFLLRCAKPSDVEDLLTLSRMLSFINLPANKEYLEEKIAISQKSFANPYKGAKKNLYLFVLEDVVEKRVVGTSMICGQHGTEEVPHFFFKISQQYKYSSTIGRGFTHETLKLGVETNGYSEIGGLMLHPDYRKNTSKLGKQISFVRFLYIALHQKAFTEQIHTELMPPLDDKGLSPLWEALGRKFFQMDYTTADQLSIKNKEFILSLFPEHPIYVAMLPSDATKAIGQVGKQTRPVVKMLKDIGFKYMEEVDPFDGGPHYRAITKDIVPIKNLFQGTCHAASSSQQQNPTASIISWENDNKDFQARSTLATINRKENKLFLPPQQLKQLNLSEGQEVCSIEMEASSK